MKDLDFKFASHMDEVIGIALKRPLKFREISSLQHEHPVLHAPSPYPVD